MKIIDDGISIQKELNDAQLTLLKQLLTLKMDEEYPDEESNMGFVIFKSDDKIKELSGFFGYDSIYMEFFFNRKEKMQAIGKIVLYDGGEPDEVLEFIQALKESLKGFKSINKIE